MAPPFVLQELKRPTRKQPIGKQIMYSKNQYNCNVKVDGWQHKSADSLSKHNSDLCNLKSIQKNPPKTECICDKYKTTYALMTNQLHLKENYINPLAYKHVFNYFGYSDDKVNPENFDSRRNFPTILKNQHNVIPEFKTTMQSSYTPPLGLIMQGLRSPEEKHVSYRRMKSVENPRINTKFRDDRINEVTKIMQCARKGKYGISYNPMTGINNDGTIPKTRHFTEAKYVN